MNTKFNHDSALELLREYNKEPFHILHGLTVGACMKWFAGELGYGDDQDFWEICGILHDIDFEMYPEEHCKKAVELLEKAGAEPEGSGTSPLFSVVFSGRLRHQHHPYAGRNGCHEKEVSGRKSDVSF